ncbi:MAG: dihydrodipicolinate synthase family protein [Actinomycetota bacterium]|jgi:dihydrodipicolinate synthase/N-acetylneuraminate lyase|nr:dihydrodipicolinate synthase family protein [Actinomycetota bacterium]
MSKEIKGIIPPLLTSFDKNGNIYKKGQREIIEFILPYIDGVYPCGTYGSGPLMSSDERKTVAEIIIEQINGRVPVIIHVGAASTRETVELAKHAAKAGADAVGAIAPYYYSYNEKELLNHYKILIDSVNIPVFLYNNPHTSGNSISPGVLNELAKYNLAGIKDSAFDLVNFYLYQIEVDNPNFKFIIGTEAIAMASFMSGAKAAICGVANVIPEPLHKFWELVQRKEWEEAQKFQMEILKIRKVMKMGSTLTNCYAILKIRGIDSGWPRMPYLPVDDMLQNKIKAELLKLNVI